MVFHLVFRVSWICFLLFNFGACVPVKRIQTGTGYSFGASPGYTSGGVASGLGVDSGYNSGGSAYTGSRATSGFSAGSNAGLSDSQDGGIAQILADLMRLRPSRSFPRFPWTFDHIPLGSVEDRLVYPSSHVVHSSSGYQRARDFRSDAKYTQDTFDHIPLPANDQESDQMTGSRGQKRTQ